jgi:hypothetical protein
MGVTGAQAFVIAIAVVAASLVGFVLVALGLH